MRKNEEGYFLLEALVSLLLLTVSAASVSQVVPVLFMENRIIDETREARVQLADYIYLDKLPAGGVYEKSDEGVLYVCTSLPGTEREGKDVCLAEHIQ
ncbi:hypothetical protein [Alkalicoccus urumqiensis]|uniref:hypothetical protein n=1 Tax=Alkalicoccus urumqiensis TaxID=1548213 RepID=UPI0015E61776|nr:hypothetical protein [Alkalicoccus urumqiensis]